MNSMIQCKPTILPLLIAGALACFGLLSLISEIRDFT